MSKLEGKVAIVTGGTSGMGRAIAELFATEGACVVIGGRNENRGLEVSNRIGVAGGRCEFVPGDVGVQSTNELLVRTALESFDGVDILVPNVGMLGIGSITEISPEEWHQTVATNLHSVFYLLRAGIPQMLKRGKGSIVVIGSIAAFKGYPRHAAYCATKAAMTALVKQLSIDYSPAIRANLICPGPVDTPMIWDSAKAFPFPAVAVQEAADKTLMKRLGRPEEIARAALFLVSEESSWVTGAALIIDGGMMCGL